MRRALQSGERHASFPLMFDWASMSTELRKFVTYRLIHFQPGSSSAQLQLLPCSLLDFVDYLEWLPTAGVKAGWSSIRHYAGGTVNLFARVRLGQHYRRLPSWLRRLARELLRERSSQLCAQGGRPTSSPMASARLR